MFLAPISHDQVLGPHPSWDNPPRPNIPKKYDYSGDHDMGTFQRHNRFFLLAIVCLSTLLAACSSGGGGGGHTKDTRPDPFNLSVASGVATENVAFDAPIVSKPFVVAGLEVAAPISIENGEYAIDDGEFTSAPGTVSNGQQVRVRMRSSVKGGQSTTAIVNIGGETASLTTKTVADNVPPEVTILFPPPASMTEGQTLFVRGSVKDVNGTLEEGAVTVNGVEAALELNQAGDEATWSVTVDLASGENTITVTAVDTEENISEGESVKSLRVTSIAGQSFPDNTVPFSGPISLDVHEVDGNTVALVTDQPAKAVIAVDLLSGKRSVFSNNRTQADNPLEYPWNIHVGENGMTYVFDWFSQKHRIYELDSEGTRELFIEADESSASIDQPFGIYLRQTSMGEYLYLADRGRVFSVDVLTKNKTVISDSENGVPNFDNPITDAVDMVFDKESERLLVISIGNQRLYLVDPETGIRTPIVVDERLAISKGALLADGKSFLAVEMTADRASIVDIPTGRVTIIAEPGDGQANTFAEPRGVVIHPSGEYALIVDKALKAVVALDLNTGQRVLLSKSQ
jgi:hypothetical protein